VFATVRTEFTQRIRALEAQLAAASAPLLNIPRLRALHERLSRTQVADLVDGLYAHDDTPGLRDLLLHLVESAHITERRPHSHPVWLRAAVSWVPDVVQLLSAGLLQLAEAAPAPVLPTSADLHRVRVRRYRQARRAKQLAAQTGTAEEGAPT
jgi:hypothetical protein